MCAVTACCDCVLWLQVLLAVDSNEIDEAIRTIKLLCTDLPQSLKLWNKLHEIAALSPTSPAEIKNNNLCSWLGLGLGPGPSPSHFPDLGSTRVHAWRVPM